MKFKLSLVLVGLLLFTSLPVAAAPANHITFNSFTGIYYLNRDSHGLSLLTTEETIVADFPPGGFTGITRSIPKKFQNHSVDVKILNVTDAAGDPVSYKTTTDNSGNLVVITGDPAIVLYGSQTIKIKYQTSGVINLNQKADEFLLDVNGRGWNEPFGRVDATLHVPASFGAAIKGTPSCYAALGTGNYGNCLINVQRTAQETVITSRAQPVAAHQTLILKLDFAPATFTSNRPSLAGTLIETVIAILVMGGVIIYARRRFL